MNSASFIDVSCAEDMCRLGFMEVDPKSQRGVVLRKHVRVWAMPYLKQQVDDEFIFSDSVATVEITESGDVQMHIESTHYAESAVPASSEEGQGLLMDALATELGLEEGRRGVRALGTAEGRLAF